MGLILQTATNFSKLFDIQYDFVLGKNNKLRNISVVFEPEDFHHLAGLQYIKDVPNLTKSRTQVFYNICNDTALRNKIYNSNFYTQITNRLLALNQLEYLFDNNHIVFQYDYKQNKQSSIRAKFLIESYDSNNAIVYVFGDYKIPHNYTAYCKSIFPKDKYDYTQHQGKYAILQKTKKQKSTGIVLSTYTNPKYNSNIR